MEDSFAETRRISLFSFLLWFLFLTLVYGHQLEFELHDVGIFEFEVFPFFFFLRRIGLELENSLRSVLGDDPQVLSFLLSRHALGSCLSWGSHGGMHADGDLE